MDPGALERKKNKDYVSSGQADETRWEMYMELAGPKQIPEYGAGEGQQYGNTTTSDINRRFIFALITKDLLYAKCFSTNWTAEMKCTSKTGYQETDILLTREFSHPGRG